MSFDELTKAFQADFDPNIGGAGYKFNEIERIPSGYFAFDLLTGGGIPRGRYIELYGKENSGKTALTLKLIANMQKLHPEKKNAFIDVEGSFDPSWARKLGVDVEKLYVFTPDYGEAVVDMVEGLLRSPECGLVILDSLAALVSTREIGQSAEKSDVGGSGLLIGKLTRKVTLALTTARKLGNEPTFIAINQVRHEIGKMFGDPEKTPGGFAPKFAASMRIRVYGKDIKDPKVHKDLPVRKAVSVIIKKYKVPVVATHGDMEIVLIPHKGYKTGDGFDFPILKKYLESYGLLEKRGAIWFFQDKEYKSLGEVKRLLETDIKFGTKIKNQIIEAEKARANGETDDGESVDVETGEILQDEPPKKKVKK